MNAHLHRRGREVAPALMISEINIENFRCFRDVKIKKCSRVNAIVGDNGVGKTALLEAIFLALGSSPDLGTRYRSHRGLDPSVSGSAAMLDRALWQDLFFRGDMNYAISIQLKGDGQDRRSLKVNLNFPKHRTLMLATGKVKQQIEESGETPRGLRFVWTDKDGHSFPQVASMSSQGLRVDAEGTVEQPIENFFYIPSTASIPASEHTSRFSQICIDNRKDAFVELLRSEYDWISDLSIQMNAGAGVLYAHVDRPIKAMRPLGYVSSGISKVIGILLCIASVKNGVVLVDEIENGIHYSRHAAVWRMLFKAAKDHNTQLIFTTHSGEWLDAMAQAGVDHADDVSLWRINQSEVGASIRQFSGPQAFAALQTGSDVR